MQIIFGKDDDKKTNWKKSFMPFGTLPVCECMLYRVVGVGAKGYSLNAIVLSLAMLTNNR